MCEGSLVHVLQQLHTEPTVAPGGWNVSAGPPRQTCEHPDNKFSCFILHLETPTSGGDPGIVFPQYSVTSLGLNRFYSKRGKIPQNSDKN